MRSELSFVKSIGIAACVAGCATSPPAEFEIHHIGRVESFRTVSTNRPANTAYVGLYAFGAIGGVVAGALSHFPSRISRYSVRTKNNELVEIEWPEQLTIGSCIAIIGEKHDIGGLSYPFPMGRVEPSDRCART